ncbi:unnamed protein product, partial [Staurois parvus]
RSNLNNTFHCIQLGRTLYYIAEGKSKGNWAENCIVYGQPILPKVLAPPSQSCDSGAPIPSMDTGVYNQGMQTASTNIGERMGRSQELSDSKHGPVIGGPPVQ